MLESGGWMDPRHWMRCYDQWPLNMLKYLIVVMRDNGAGDASKEFLPVLHPYESWQDRSAELLTKKLVQNSPLILLAKTEITESRSAGSF